MTESPTPAASAPGPSPRSPRHVRLHTRTRRLIWQTIRAYFMDNVSRLGAALAFYATIAIAPLLVMTVAVAAMVFEDEARVRVLEEIEKLAGSPVGAALEDVDRPDRTVHSITATILGGATLAFGAFGVFHHLQEALNSIWRVHPPENLPWWRLVLRRLVSLATVLATGVLLLTSLVLSAALTWAGTQAVEQWGGSAPLLQALNLSLSFAMMTFLFAMIFKLLPDRTVPWRHVWLGATVTALLFTVGKTVLAYYLGRAAIASFFGAAGSVLALLLWAYYAGQIVFLGAELTRVATMSDGGRDFSFLRDPLQRVRSV